MARIETTVAANRAWTEDRPAVRWRLILDVFLRLVSLGHLVWALWQWAALIGIVPSLIGDPGRAPLPRQGAAFFFAGIDPVAAVGLWLGSTWGVATWLVVTFARILIHTAYAGIFDWTPGWTAFQFATVTLYVVLFLLAERADRESRKKQRRRPADQA